MKIWQFLAAIAVAASLFSVALDPVGRVTLIVLITGIAEIGFGLCAVMALFQTIGSLAMARGILDVAQALVATGFVLLLGAVVMSFSLSLGCYLVLATVR